MALAVVQMNCFVLALLVSFVPTTLAYVDRLPQPNVCVPDHQIWGLENTILSSGKSRDCPQTALCISGISTNASSPVASCFCSCTHADHLLVEENGKCVASRNTYILSGFWVLMTLAGILLWVMYAIETTRAIRSRLFRLDYITTSFLFSWLALTMFNAHAVLFVYLLIGRLDASSYETVTTIRTVVVVFQAAFVLGALMILGIALHSIVADSAKLSVVDTKSMKQRVVCVALSSTTVMIMIAVPLMYSGQYALSTATFALFSMITWILFRVLFRAVTELCELTLVQQRPDTTTQSTSTNPPPSPAVKAQQPRREAANHTAVLRLTQRVAKQILVSNSIYFISALSLSVFWFLGHQTLNPGVLSVGVASSVACSFGAVLAGMWMTKNFVQNLTLSRIARASLSTPKSTGAKVIIPRQSMVAQALDKVRKLSGSSSKTPKSYTQLSPADEPVL